MSVSFCSLRIISYCYDTAQMQMYLHGIIGYSFSIFYMLFEGIAVGVQPIIGFNYGAGLYGQVCKTLRLAMTACVSVGALGFLVFSCSGKIVQFFTRWSSSPWSLWVVWGYSCFHWSCKAWWSNATYFQSINRVGPLCSFIWARYSSSCYPFVHGLMVFGLREYGSTPQPIIWCSS